MPEITKRLSVVLDIFGSSLQKKKQEEIQEDYTDDEFNNQKWDDWNF